MTKYNYNWFKFRCGFFSRSDVANVESYPHGKEYLLFYIKLICLSLENEGTIVLPRTQSQMLKMISESTKTNISTVKNALKVLKEKDFITDDDYKLKIVGFDNMVGKYADNTNAVRQKRFREKLRENKEKEYVANLEHSQNEDGFETAVKDNSLGQKRDRRLKGENYLNEGNAVSNSVSNGVTNEKNIVTNGVTVTLQNNDISYFETNETKEKSDDNYCLNLRENKEPNSAGARERLMENKSSYEDLMAALDLVSEDLKEGADEYATSYYVSVMRNLADRVAKKRETIVCGEVIPSSEVLKTFCEGIESGKDEVFIETIREVSSRHLAGEVTNIFDYLVSTLYNRIKGGGAL